LDESLDEAAEFEPLPSDWGQRATAMSERFLLPRMLLPAEQACIQRFAHLCLRYAYSERRIQGDILCDIPAHLSVLRGQQHPSLEEEAESLAQAERENLGVPPGPIEDLGELLDERGIKILEWPEPAGHPAGAFLFEEETGPALLALTCPGSPQRAFILAHEYCHLLADVDPYESRFCTHGDYPRADGSLLAQNELADPAEDTLIPERRADLFARSLLMPREHFLDTLGEFGMSDPADIHLGRLQDLAFYYRVDTAAILGRLVDLEQLSIVEARLLDAEQVPGPSGPAHQPDPIATLPRRFVDLSLALYMRREVSRTQLGVLLDLAPDRLKAFLDWISCPVTPS
jgi:Zn-dependent peptidase ImmA (M78 family)